MIPADFIFTEKLCIIRHILTTRPRYLRKVPGETKIVELMDGNLKLALRYDSKQRTYVLKNQYKENGVSNQAKIFISFLMGYGLPDECPDFIKINNEKIPLDIRGLFITVYLLFIIRKIPNLASFPKCNLLCPFKNICSFSEEINIEDIIMDPVSTLNKVISGGYIFEGKEDEAKNLFETMKQQMINSMGDLLSYSYRSKNLLEVVKKYKEEKMDLSTAYHELAGDLEKERADTVMEVANDIMNLNFKRREIPDIQKYNGYLKQRDDVIIPSDKFWRLLLKRPMEDEILEIYENFVKS